MIRPMSPEPRMTTSFPMRTFWRLTRFWAEPAVKMPAGRVPGVSHGQNDGLGPDELVAATGIDPQDPVRRQIEDHGPGFDADALAPDILGQPLRVLWAADRLLIKKEAEAVVDALIEDAAGRPVAFDEEDVLGPRPPSAQGRGQPGRTAADDDDVMGLDDQIR
jgi:hypothetical protein